MSVQLLSGVYCAGEAAANSSLASVTQGNNYADLQNRLFTIFQFIFVAREFPRFFITLVAIAPRSLGAFHNSTPLSH